MPSSSNDPRPGSRTPDSGSSSVQQGHESTSAMPSGDDQSTSEVLERAEHEGSDISTDIVVFGELRRVETFASQTSENAAGGASEGSRPVEPSERRARDDSKSTRDEQRAHRNSHPKPREATGSRKKRVPAENGNSASLEQEWHRARGLNQDRTRAQIWQSIQEDHEAIQSKLEPTDQASHDPEKLEMPDRKFDYEDWHIRNPDRMEDSLVLHEAFQRAIPTQNNSHNNAPQESPDRSPRTQQSNERTYVREPNFSDAFNPFGVSSSDPAIVGDINSAERDIENLREAARARERAEYQDAEQAHERRHRRIVNEDGLRPILRSSSARNQSPTRASGRHAHFHEVVDIDQPRPVQYEDDDDDDDDDTWSRVSRAPRERQRAEPGARLESSRSRFYSPEPLGEEYSGRRASEPRARLERPRSRLHSPESLGEEYSRRRGSLPYSSPRSLPYDYTRSSLGTGYPSGRSRSRLDSEPRRASTGYRQDDNGTPFGPLGLEGNSREKADHGYYGSARIRSSRSQVRRTSDEGLIISSGRAIDEPVSRDAEINDPHQGAIGVSDSDSDISDADSKSSFSFSLPSIAPASFLEEKDPLVRQLTRSGTWRSVTMSNTKLNSLKKELKIVHSHYSHAPTDGDITLSLTSEEGDDDEKLRNSEPLFRWQYVLLSQSYPFKPLNPNLGTSSRVKWIFRGSR